MTFDPAHDRGGKSGAHACWVPAATRHRVVIHQPLGKSAKAQDAIRKARKALPGGGRDLWLDRLRGSHMAQAKFQFFSQHFTDAWNATQENAPP